MGVNKDCTTCPDRCPDIECGNKDFFEFWNVIQKCFHMCGTMDGIYPVSMNWVEVELLARIHRVSLTRQMIIKIKVAEELTIENVVDSKKR